MQTEVERRAQAVYDRDARIFIGILFALLIIMLGVLLWL